MPVRMWDVFFSGLGGAVLGAAFAYLTALRQMRHQSEMLDRAYEKNLRLLREEARFKDRVQILNEIYDFYTHRYDALRNVVKDLHAGWKEALETDGPGRFDKRLHNFQMEFKSANVDFQSLLEKYSYHGDIYAAFKDTLSYQSTITTPCSQFRLVLRNVRDRVGSEEIASMEKEAKGLDDAINTMDKLVDGGWKAAREMLSRLHAAEQQDTLSGTKA